MRHIHLLDTSIGSGNRGDDIIVDCAKRHLMPFISDSFISTSSSHDGLGRYSRKLAEKSSIAFLLGSNALASEFRGGKFHWRVLRGDIPALTNKVVLVGVGAHKDFEKVGRRQILFLRRILSKTHYHSVRDAQAGEILESCGLKFINTSCPTLWDYGKQEAKLCRNRESVCFTLTARTPHPMDSVLIQILSDLYDSVYFWPQQEEDLEYMGKIKGTSKIHVVPGNLPAYDGFLSSLQPDYVGTRLHGGIRAMSHNCSTLVISIDNRGRSLGEEAGVPTLERHLLGMELDRRLQQKRAVMISVDARKIDYFLEQFK